MLHLPPSPSWCPALTFCPLSCCSPVPPEAQAEQYTLYPGDRLELSCTAKTEFTPQAANWTKDHAAVLDGEHMRLRNGALEIKGVEPADSGLYVCTTFGNHSLYFSVNVSGD